MRRKGIGTELINKLTEYSFKNIKKERIILTVYSWNVGAIKCYEKVGNENWETIEMKKSLIANKVYN